VKEKNSPAMLADKSLYSLTAQGNITIL